jgi:hypothetical protein
MEPIVLLADGNLCGTNAHLPTIRELEGIGDEIRQHLPDAAWITDQSARNARSDE